MGKLRQQLTEPLSSVSDRPWHFGVWCFVAIVLGSAGFWLPITLVAASGGAAAEKCKVLISAGALASFSLVLLAEGIASVSTVVGAGSNVTAAGMRGFFSSVAIGLAVVDVGGLTFSHPSGIISNTWLVFQLLLALLTVAVASYLYCFRFPSWEKDVNDVKEREDEEVEHLSESARAKTADEGGAKL
jgi:hypothetical protein